MGAARSETCQSKALMKALADDEAEGRAGPDGGASSAILLQDNTKALESEERPPVLLGSEAMSQEAAAEANALAQKLAPKPLLAPLALPEQQATCESPTGCCEAFMGAVPISVVLDRYLAAAQAEDVRDSPRAWRQRVRFDRRIAKEEILGYAEVYGMNPSRFNFNRHGEMEPVNLAFKACCGEDTEDDCEDLDAGVVDTDSEVDPFSDGCGES